MAKTAAELKHLIFLLEDALCFTSGKEVKAKKVAWLKELKAELKQIEQNN